MTKGGWIMYSDMELAWIKRRRKQPRKKAHAAFCKEFSRDDVSLINYNALCKRNGWLTGRTGHYEKGNVPHNNGKKMPFNEKVARTQFKKGHVPHNAKYLGHERLTKEGYVEVSLNETNPYTGFERRYVLKHRAVWEKQNGKVPEGMYLKCLDGNRQNTDPSNWELLPLSAQPFLNGHRGHHYESTPEELRPSVIALAKVKAAAASRLRKEPTHDR